ncbi:hypothetical protein AHiyo4_10890 [Arthrobacter sp. Hiyo4]|nr:hypothetical protein AHiyo4_10890 [Arthrobacter sp. Hiyo4]
MTALLRPLGRRCRGFLCVDGVRGVPSTSVKPYHHIVGELVIGRFTTSKAISRFAIEADLTGVGIDPEIQAWAGFK